MINKTKEEKKMKAETKKEFDALVKYVYFYAYIY